MLLYIFVFLVLVLVLVTTAAPQQPSAILPPRTPRPLRENRISAAAQHTPAQHNGPKSPNSSRCQSYRRRCRRSVRRDRCTLVRQGTVDVARRRRWRGGDLLLQLAGYNTRQPLLRLLLVISAVHTYIYIYNIYALYCVIVFAVYLCILYYVLGTMIMYFPVYMYNIYYNIKAPKSVWIVLRKSLYLNKSMEYYLYIIYYVSPILYYSIL
jgi:hypothetical protein